MRRGRIGWVLLALAIGCGGKEKPAEPSEPAPTRPGEAAIGAACAQMGAVHEETPCEFLIRARFSLERCRGAMATSRARLPERLKPQYDDTMRCLARATDCDGFPPCFVSFERHVAATGAGRKCGKQGIRPVALSAGEAAERYGQGVSRLSETPTTKARPIEVCGAAAQHRWLNAARCDDGSAPLSALGSPYEARVGSVGAGGRCASMIDKYRVECPEKTYEVFMDLYMCGPGESP